jgi:hypothetical protein
MNEEEGTLVLFVYNACHLVSTTTSTIIGHDTGFIVLAA